MAPEADSTSRRTAQMEISNMTVQVMREYTGRCPTKAETTIAERLVAVLMEDTLLKGEQTLIDAGEEDRVLETRPQVPGGHA